MPKKKQLSQAAVLTKEINNALELTNPVKLGSDPYFEITRIPTGSLVVDRITGGGFAHGRHIELYGDESSCKSYLAYSAMAHSQARGNLCALVDAEHSFDLEWFSRLGGKPEELMLHQPDKAEDAVGVMMILAKAAQEYPIEVITVDSVSTLVPREETEKDPREEARIAGQARMMSRALRLLTTSNRKTIFIWINQERTNVGIRFGNPRVTSGGKALRFYASTRVELRKGTTLKAKRRSSRAGKLVEHDAIIGRWISARVEKDKTTHPFREGSFIFGSGDEGNIDVGSEIIGLGLEDGLIQQSGNSYSYTGLDDVEYRGTYKRFQKMLKDNDEIRQELIDQITDNTRQAEIG